ncbi:MAG: hypothetical protein C4K49_11370 [Candidatus Thorarchaeota archaeon]|nr:MAG: hypothetical protein C4K49_11370 [Candidatus Thorarchaeota archaeon]
MVFCWVSQQQVLGTVRIDQAETLDVEAKATPSSGRTFDCIGNVQSRSAVAGFQNLRHADHWSIPRRLLVRYKTSPVRLTRHDRTA